MKNQQADPLYYCFPSKKSTIHFLNHNYNNQYLCKTLLPSPMTRKLSRAANYSDVLLIKANYLIWQPNPCNLYKTNTSDQSCVTQTANWAVVVEFLTPPEICYCNHIANANVFKVEYSIMLFNLVFNLPV